MGQPLDDVRVLDLTRILSGPFCTMLLGDMGAEVIKVEGLLGDPIRGFKETEDTFSWYFASFNRNKRSVCLDLRSDAGRDHLAELIKGSDVLVENFKPGVLADMGFDQTRLDELNPRLIVASINGFGSDGPYSKRPAVDFIVQALSGFMSGNGHEDEEPLRCGFPISDILAGIYAAIGVLAALRVRDRDGVAQNVCVSMLDSLMSTFAFRMAHVLATGVELPRTGNQHPQVAPYGIFETAHGQVAIAPSTDEMVKRLVTELGLRWMLADDRFRTKELRVANRSATNKLVSSALRAKTSMEWVEHLNAAGIPCGVVNTIAEAIADPQVAHRQTMISVDHGERGVIRMPGFPIKLAKTPCKVRHPAPNLGEHTDALLHKPVNS